MKNDKYSDERTRFARLNAFRLYKQKGLAELRRLYPERLVNVEGSRSAFARSCSTYFLLSVIKYG